jgi:hypothetical protein
VELLQHMVTRAVLRWGWTYTAAYHPWARRHTEDTRCAHWQSRRDLRCVQRCLNSYSGVAGVLACANALAASLAMSALLWDIILSRGIC